MAPYVLTIPACCYCSGRTSYGCKKVLPVASVALPFAATVDSPHMDICYFPCCRGCTASYLNGPSSYIWQETPATAKYQSRKQNQKKEACVR